MAARAAFAPSAALSYPLEIPLVAEDKRLLRVLRGIFAAAGRIVTIDSKRWLVAQPLQFRGYDGAMHRPERDPQSVDGACKCQTTFAREGARAVIA
jgi:hypothetical protein